MLSSFLFLFLSFTLGLGHTSHTSLLFFFFFFFWVNYTTISSDPPSSPFFQNQETNFSIQTIPTNFSIQTISKKKKKKNLDFSIIKRKKKKSKLKSISHTSATTPQTHRTTKPTNQRPSWKAIHHR